MSKHLKILLGGSPCTHWSIAQSKDRETTASGAASASGAGFARGATGMVEL